MNTDLCHGCIYINICSIGTCPVSDDFSESKYQIVGFWKVYFRGSVLTYLNTVQYNIVLYYIRFKTSVNRKFDSLMPNRDTGCA